MAEIAPLRALRYADQSEPLGDLLCPPYDVISDGERDRLYGLSPSNFVRVEYPKPDGDPYARAAAAVSDEVHRVWAIGDRLAIGELREAFAKSRLYIADGHHRYETALTYLGERGGPADAPQRFVLAYLCALDDAGLRILATHR